MFRSTRTRRPKSADVNVAIVAENPGTIDKLQRYLVRAGVEVRSVLSLEMALVVARDARVVVVFPDDFDRERSCKMLTLVHRERPDVLLVVVTSEPARFADLGGGDPEKRVLVLPRPAWGWTILDAIRGCLGRSPNTDS